MNPTAKRTNGMRVPVTRPTGDGDGGWGLGRGRDVDGGHVDGSRGPDICAPGPVGGVGVSITVLALNYGFSF